MCFVTVTNTKYFAHLVCFFCRIKRESAWGSEKRLQGRGKHVTAMVTSSPHWPCQEPHSVQHATRVLLPRRHSAALVSIQVYNIQILPLCTCGAKTKTQVLTSVGVWRCLLTKNNSLHMSVHPCNIKDLFKQSSCVWYKERERHDIFVFFYISFLFFPSLFFPACNVTIHNRCRDTLPNCAKMKQRVRHNSNH